MTFLSRREMLTTAGAGFGAVALAGLADSEATAATLGAAGGGNPLAAKPPHVAGRAKSVIFLFMEGGPSHIDLFDPKPALEKLAGQPVPESFGRVITAMGEFDSPILPSKRKWRQHGQGGLWISDWLPHMATKADELAVIRSCWTNGINHSGGVCQMNTASISSCRFFRSAMSSSSGGGGGGGTSSSRFLAANLSFSAFSSRAFASCTRLSLD